MKLKVWEIESDGGRFIFLETEKRLSVTICSHESWPEMTDKVSALKSALLEAFVKLHGATDESFAEVLENQFTPSLDVEADGILEVLKAQAVKH